MTEQEQLLEAVFAAPKDDASRLVYADWLEEHGDPEHAALIRFQCNADPVLASSGRWGAWRQRKKQVWGACVRAWGEAFPGVKLKRGLFERGMPKGILVLDADVLMRLPDPLWPRLPFRRIRVEGAEKLTPEFVQNPSLTRFEELHLQSSYAETVRRFPQPRHLIPKETVFTLLASSQLKELRTLRLVTVAFTRTLIDALVKSPLLESLEELSLHGATDHYRPTLDAARNWGDFREQIQRFVRYWETQYAPDCFPPD